MDPSAILLGDVCDTRFVVLLGSMTVEEARASLADADFTHVIVIEADPQHGESYHLFEEEWVRGRLGEAGPDAPIEVALDLAGSPAAPVRRADSDAFEAPRGAVVVREGYVAGFVGPPATATSERLKRLSFGVRESLVSVGGAADVEAAESFGAYPSLSSPGRVVPGAGFRVRVGFRGDLDPLIATSGRIEVASAGPSAECRVHLGADGAKVAAGIGSLPLRVDASCEFACEVEPGAEEVLLTARYYFRGQTIGWARRRIPVGGAAGDTSLVCGALGPPTAEGDVDLTVTIVRSGRTDVLRWIIVAPRPEISVEATSVLARADALRMAAELIRDLRDAGPDGDPATNTLESFGQEIATRMPPEFFDALSRVRRAVGRDPTLLLLSDETAIPWELAEVPGPPDGSSPRMLAAQAVMGRWLEDPNAMLPPASAVRVGLIHAVAAEKYAVMSGFRTLDEAIKERETLRARWGAIPLEATRAGIQPLVGAPVPGHLLHVATHGLSSPTANDEALVLADGSLLRPPALVGGYRRGETPRFAFVFLNACQVGAPGTSLGQAAGFPGLLIRRGTSGFIAPLWEVDDAHAREVAEAFYERTIGADGQAVGEVLRAQRRRFAAGGATAPLAYVYYGHPLLRLSRKPA